MSDELDKCRQELAEIKAENATLRKAAEAFGALAERLNQALQEERRSGVDRRVALRPTADRRVPPTVSGPDGVRDV